MAIWLSILLSLDQKCKKNHLSALTRKRMYMQVSLREHNQKTNAEVKTVSKIENMNTIKDK